MNRRSFIEFSVAGTTYASLLGSRTTFSQSFEGIDHPNEVMVSSQNDSIAPALQQALEQAYQLWLNDSEKRRPVIRIPAGTYYIDEIIGNTRGDYPFHLPPTFKLLGSGKTATIIINRTHTLTAQYRLFFTRPASRLDVLENCNQPQQSCIDSYLQVLGPAHDIEICQLALHDFDYAIGLREAQNCYLHDCLFKGSLVAIQLVMGDVFGNLGHQIENCEFDARTDSYGPQRFCLRFEAPFSNVWSETETGVPNLAECQALGGDEQDYNANYQTCVLPRAEGLIEYLDMFGSSAQADLVNSQCVISGCQFSYASYSAIELAGKLNQHNICSYNSFYACSGTAIEFDKGASFNLATYNVISGMRPTTAFAPEIPYIFQAAIQEQQGNASADRRLKTLISEMGYANVGHVNYRGEDIYSRAATLPQGNEISHNQFDTSLVYAISEYESNPAKAANLPDVYPSIKLHQPLDTLVTHNSEFIGNPLLAPSNSNIIGQSLVIYPDDDLRDRRGGVQIEDNQFHGGLFVVGDIDAPKANQPWYIRRNEFGQTGATLRGGLNCNLLKADYVELTNNQFVCSNDTSSSVMQRLDIKHLICSNNQFSISAANSFYLRSLSATNPRANRVEFSGNNLTGGLAVSIYDWTDSSWQNDSSQTPSDDLIQIENNLFRALAGNSKVVAITLWARNLQVNNNRFESFQHKIYQLYALSDTFNHDGLNQLVLDSSAQDRVYSRNYYNANGQYITGEFWTE